MKKTHLAISALAIAFAMAPLAELQAASLVNPDSRPQVDSLAQVVKAKMGKKKHARKHKRAGKRHARGGKGPGRCGENMYWSGKSGRCMDARDKA